MTKLVEAEAADGHLLSRLALESKAYWDYSIDFIEACKEDLTIDESYIEKNHVFILTDGHEWIGFFAYQKGEPDRLDFLYLAPQFIGQGYGRKIWSHVIKQARELGIRRFTIDSDPYAQGFYEKMGAVKIAEAESTVFPGRKLPLMEVIIKD